MLVAWSSAAGVPGAYLAAAIFALHPVQVESVAWITEHEKHALRRVLSRRLLVYLRFDRDAEGLVVSGRRWGCSRWAC